MKQAQNHGQNRPPRGTTTRVEPLRDLAAIAKIKTLLAPQPRNLALFTLGINTAYRTGELLSLRIGQVLHLRAGDMLTIKQSKTSAYRATSLNAPSIAALQSWLAVHPFAHNLSAPLFSSQRKPYAAIKVATVNHLMKKWSKQAGLSGNYGAHSLRKTWGYHQRIIGGASVALLMKAYGHASESQTLAYLGILPTEIHALYQELEL